MSKTKTKGITISVAGAIGQVMSIGGFGYTVETQDVTELGNDVKAFLATISELDEVPFTVFFDPDSHDDVFDLRSDQLDSGEAASCSIVFPEPASKTYSFSAWVTGFKFQSMEPGGVIKADITLKPTGDFS